MTREELKKVNDLVEKRDCLVYFKEALQKCYEIHLETRHPRDDKYLITEILKHGGSLFMIMKNSGINYLQSQIDEIDKQLKELGLED